MGFAKTLLLASACAFSVLAAPVPECSSGIPKADAAAPAATYPTTPSVTAEQLTLIEPATSSCDGAPFPAECADADKAAPAINTSFTKYGITSTGEQAALVAYMLFESGKFKYSQNHFPGRPGQGTRMMAMPPFVQQYATAVAGADAVAAQLAAGGDAGLKNVLALVNSDDEKSFGSAAWFLSTQCTPDVRAGLAAETLEGWHNFLTICVGTTTADERDTLWVAAKQHMLADKPQ